MTVEANPAHEPFVSPAIVGDLLGRQDVRARGRDAGADLRGVPEACSDGDRLDISETCFLSAGGGPGRSGVRLYGPGGITAKRYGRRRTSPQCQTPRRRAESLDDGANRKWSTAAVNPIRRRQISARRGYARNPERPPLAGATDARWRGLPARRPKYRQVSVSQRWRTVRRGWPRVRPRRTFPIPTPRDRRGLLNRRGDQARA
jgi:hypothetical protein